MFAITVGIHLFCIRLKNTRMKKVIVSFLLILSISFAIQAQEDRSSGLASVYPTQADGEMTANGEVYKSNLLTASHATLPFGTIVKVTNIRNGESVLVRINDRFKFKTNRVIDLSAKAGKEIHLFSDVAPLVNIEVIELPKEETKVEESTSDEG